jgi:hypothetical protein
MTSIRKVMKRICCFSVSNAEGKLISSVIEAQTNLHGRNELNGLAGWRNDLRNNIIRHDVSVSKVISGLAFGPRRPAHAARAALGFPCDRFRIGKDLR